MSGTLGQWGKGGTGRRCVFARLITIFDQLQHVAKWQISFTPSQSLATDKWSRYGASKVNRMAVVRKSLLVLIIPSAFTPVPE